MYEGDSFLTLSFLGQVGLVLLSVVLTVCVVMAVLRVGRGRTRAVRVWIAFMAFWAFLWLSPQIYYLYYITLFDGLPWQSVIKSPPSLTDMFKLLTFTDAPNLSNHGKGLLGWVMMVIGVWGRPQNRSG